MPLNPATTCVRLEQVDSTNRYGLARADELAGGTVIVADEQTAGRGRMGRRWESPPGVNLYVSILLKPPFLRAEPSLFPQLAALATHDTLHDLGLPHARIKWPNDITVGGRKIAGLLCESSRQGQSVSAMVVGVGINVNLSPEACAAIDQPATSILAELGREIDRDDVLERLLTYFNGLYGSAQLHGFDAIYPRWRSASGLLGQQVRLLIGEEVIEGTIADLLPDGSLRLTDATGSERTFQYGDVSLRPADEAPSALPAARMTNG